MKAINHIDQKIVPKVQLEQWVCRWRFASKKIVFTNGIFDIIHAGHIHSLKRAATFGDVLVVGLNSDASATRLKGESRPIQTWADRAEVLSSLVMVDAVVGFEEDTPLDLIRTILPDVLVKGGDYTIDTIVGANEVIAAGGKVEIISLVPGQSTTRLAQILNGL